MSSPQVPASRCPSRFACTLAHGAVAYATLDVWHALTSLCHPDNVSQSTRGPPTAPGMRASISKLRWRCDAPAAASPVWRCSYSSWTTSRTRAHVLTQPVDVESLHWLRPTEPRDTAAPRRRRLKEAGPLHASQMSAALSKSFIKTVMHLLIMVYGPLYYSRWP